MNENTQTAVAKTNDREVIYQAFGSNEQLRLSVAMVGKFVAKATWKGNTPSEVDCIKFIMFCKARKLNPFEGDAFLVGYETKNGPEFSLISSHQALLKRAEVNPNYNGMESGVIIRDTEGNIVDREGDFTFEEDTLLGGWATVYFVNGRKPMKRRAALRSFAKDTAFWERDPAGMIVKCAEADALRSSFPTMLGGLYIAQEMKRIESGTDINVDTPSFETTVQVAQRKWDEAGEKVKAEKAKAIEVLSEPRVKPNEAQESADGFAPATPKPEEKMLTIYEGLQAELDKAGITFDALRKWAGETGQLDNADSFGSLDEIPKAKIMAWKKNFRVILNSVKPQPKDNLL